MFNQVPTIRQANWIQEAGWETVKTKSISLGLTKKREWSCSTIRRPDNKLCIVIHYQHFETLYFSRKLMVIWLVYIYCSMTIWCTKVSSICLSSKLTVNAIECRLLLIIIIIMDVLIIFLRNDMLYCLYIHYIPSHTTHKFVILNFLIDIGINIISEYDII